MSKKGHYDWASGTPPKLGAHMTLQRTPLYQATFLYLDLVKLIKPNLLMNSWKITHVL